MGGASFERALLDRNWRSLSQRVIRAISAEEAGALLEAAEAIPPPVTGMAEEATPFLGALHPTETISRARRDLQLRQQALKAYGYRCALTGVKQASPFGTHEVECCHFVPVAVGGANVIQNVILICRTFHWLMDNFLISREDDFRIIWKSTLDRRYVKWLNRSGYARVPREPALRPSLDAIRHHRSRFEKAHS